jgi:hypothetical protein
MDRLRTTGWRGALAGFTGAATLALWFLAIDAARGDPLATVGLLASTLLGSGGAGVDPVLVTVFTLLHFALFMVLAIGVAKLLDTLRTAPNTLYGFVLGFVLFDIMFYVGVGRGGGSVAAALGWPEVLAGNLLAGIVVMGILRVLAPVHYSGWWESLTESRVIREGLVAGVLGGAVVALWFLLLDTVAGRPMYTPAALGSALFLGVADPSEVRIEAASIIGYSIVHFGTFIASGLVAAAILTQAERRPNLLLFGGMLFVVFLAFLMAALALFAEWIIGSLAWWNVALGNLLATVAMGIFLLRAHPSISLAMGQRALAGEEPVSSRV